MMRWTIAIAALLATGPLLVQARADFDDDVETCATPSPKSSSKKGSGLLQGSYLNLKTATAPPGLLVVPLQRLPARGNGTKRSIHVGNISVGYPPQRMLVAFDTSSPYILLPHRTCKSRACQEHRRYSSWRSSTSADVDWNGTRIQKNNRLVRGKVMRDTATIEFTNADFGKGKATGALVKDKVCLVGKNGVKSCTNPVILVAQNLSDSPFREMPSDGIVGLALPGMAECPMCQLMGKLFNNTRHSVAQFGITLGATGGELHIGGHDPAALAAPLQWFAVHKPEEGYWQVPIFKVRVGNTTIDACERGCHAVMDTTASRLGVQASNLPKLQSSLKTSLGADGSCQGPELEFDLGGMSVKLGPEDYTADCTPDLGPLDLEEPAFHGVYAFGEMVLRHYFVAFDWQNKKMGFAPSAVSTHEMAHKAPVGAVVEQFFM